MAILLAILAALLVAIVFGWDQLRKGANAQVANGVLILTTVASLLIWAFSG